MSVVVARGFFVEEEEDRDIEEDPCRGGIEDVLPALGAECGCDEGTDEAADIDHHVEDTEGEGAVSFVGDASDSADDEGFKDGGTDADAEESGEEGRHGICHTEEEVGGSEDEVSNEEHFFVTVAIAERPGDEGEEIDEESDGALNDASVAGSQTEAAVGDGVAHIDGRQCVEAVPRHTFDDFHDVGDPKGSRQGACGFFHAHFLFRHKPPKKDEWPRGYIGVHVTT